MKTAVPILCGMFVLLGSAACETTHVTTVWKSPDGMPAHPFNKVVALVLNATPGERRAAEDTLAAAIKTATGIPAYTMLSDEDLKSRETMRYVLTREGIDGAAVIRLISSEKQTRTYTSQPVATNAGFYDWNASGSLDRTTYSVTDTNIFAELSVYSVESGKLLWSGQSKTVNPSGVQDLVRQVSKSAAEEIRRQGLLK